MLEQAEREVPLAFDKAGKLIHRYIDDLESLSHVMEYSANARLSLILLFASRSYAFFYQNLVPRRLYPRSTPVSTS
jgi:hypothetical protein